MKVINGHVIHSQGSALAVWRSTIGLTARQHEVKKIEGPVSMQLQFFMKKPRTVKRELPTVPPDLDKLIRAVLDALTGIAYEDDAQVVEIKASKTYDESTGVLILIQSGSRVGRYRQET
jgi:Holliday junction resolvase RusA-like endonuclease